jgi:hypothetical protein
MQELMQENESGFSEFFHKLITSDINERREMAKRSDTYGAVAEMSLYMHPALLVHICALLKGTDFWSIWDMLPSHKYDDMYERRNLDTEKTEETEIKNPMKFYEGITRKNQDEFLEFWDGENLILSDRLKRSIEAWKKIYEDAADLSPEAVSDFLSDVLYDLEHDWKCRFVDREFVDLILSNKDQPSYRKALRTLREWIDKDVMLFPELTRSQSMDWVISNYINKYDRINLSAYLSLMINEPQRRKIFGF